MSDQDSPTTRRLAVVYNPIKVTDGFRDTLSARLEPAGWTDTLWLETSKEDPGRAMITEAVEAGVDRVIGAGGDGTIRIVADGLAGTGIGLGLVPAGTGNLLARNLGLPLAEAEAIEVALGDHSRTIDLIKLTVDQGHAEHFAVMAGTGLDAMIMDETNDALKAKIGSAAYFLAAGKALGRLPMKVAISVDGHRAHRRTAMLCVIGNVGELQANITLIPEAKPDDGLLNVYVASPRNPLHWIRVILRLITRRPLRDDKVDEWVGKRVDVRIKDGDNYQLDGDVIGKARQLSAEVVPGALTVYTPTAPSA
ncbi:MAG: Diacylglycerol kinase family enzyme [Friedmanniella sp.]|nr:Diacylglycerol kinase family enzyme [Friedmanniella sp.]